MLEESYTMMELIGLVSGAAMLATIVLAIVVIGFEVPVLKEWRKW